MAVTTDNQVKLSDGQSVGYAEYGDPHGTPVLHFHGLPSSRFELDIPITDEIATRLHVRVIVIERPGIGLSEFRPYSIASYPDMVLKFAEALHLDRFAVTGYSSGGKYVAACAWKIPQLLTAAGIASGNCAYELPGAKETLSSQDNLLYTLASKTPWLFRLFLGKIASDARKNPSSILSLFTGVAEVDKTTLSRADIQHLLAEMLLGAFQQGTKGVAWDWRLEALPWGFPLKEISLPVNIWHGEQDKIVSVQQGHIMAQAMPSARTTLFANDGHISIMANHFEEMIGTLVS